MRASLRREVPESSFPAGRHRAPARKGAAERERHRARLPSVRSEPGPASATARGARMQTEWPALRMTGSPISARSGVAPGAGNPEAAVGRSGAAAGWCRSRLAAPSRHHRAAPHSDRREDRSPRKRPCSPASAACRDGEESGRRRGPAGPSEHEVRSTIPSDERPPPGWSEAEGAAGSFPALAAHLIIGAGELPPHRPPGRHLQRSHGDGPAARHPQTTGLRQITTRVRRRPSAESGCARITPARSFRAASRSRRRTRG